MNRINLTPRSTEQIEQLLQRNELKQTLDLLETIVAKDSAPYRELSAHMGRYHALNQKIRLGVLSEAEQERQQNALRDSLWSFVEGLKGPKAGLKKPGHKRRLRPRSFVLLLLVPALAGLGLYQQQTLQPAAPVDTEQLKDPLPWKFTQELFKAHPRLAERYPLDAQHVTFVDIWLQIFEKGRIIYIVSIGRVYICYSEHNRYKQTQPVEQIITEGGGNEIVRDQVMSEMLERYVRFEEDKAIYKDLAEKHTIRGGIATIYIRDDLFRDLGYPSENKTEWLRLGVAMIEKGEHLLLSGLPNRDPRAHPGAAYELNLETGEFRRYVLPYFELHPPMEE